MSPIRKEMHRDTDWLPQAGDKWKVGPTEITVTDVQSIPVPGGRDQIKAILLIEKRGEEPELAVFQAHAKGYGRAWQAFMRKVAVRRGWPFEQQERPAPGRQ